MADSSEPSNTPHIEEVDDPQRAMTIYQPQTESIVIDDDEDESEFLYDPDIDEDYRRYLIHYFARNSGRTDQFIEPDDDEDDEDYVDDDFDAEEEEAEEEEEDSYSEEEDDDDEEEEEEVEIDLMVTSPRVSINSVDAVVVGEPIGGGGGGEAVAAGEGGEIDGLMCPICMGPWTSGGDHQVCCLSCGHLYGLSCIRRWLEHRKGSAKCPQCNKKCKPKDVRVIYASRVVVADEESKEKIKHLEAKCALLEKKNETLIKKNDDMLELIDEQSKLLSRQTERVNHLMTTQQSEINALQSAQTESARSMDRLQAEHTESERRFQQFEEQQSESLQRIRQWMSVAGIDVSRPPPPPPLWTLKSRMKKLGRFRGVVQLRSDVYK